jgi:hypothetical protein
MTKCLFCDNEAKVFSNWGYICERCCSTLEAFYEAKRNPEKMTIEELQILERIYTIYVTEWNEVLQKIKNEIEKRGKVK